jgi:hypothetical protein
MSMTIQKRTAQAINVTATIEMDQPDCRASSANGSCGNLPATSDLSCGIDPRLHRLSATISTSI